MPSAFSFCSHGLNRLVSGLQGRPENTERHQYTAPAPVRGKMAKTYYFNITYACNNNCVFCAANYYGKGSKPSSELKVPEFKSILKDLNIRPGDNIIINGGEPTVHKDFFSFIEVIQEMSGYPILFTNGVRLHDINFVRRLSELGPMRILVPFFSAAPEKHDRLTGRKGNFKKTIDGFANAITLKEKGAPFDLEAKLLLCGATYEDNPAIAETLMKQWPNLFYFSLNPLLMYKKVMENRDLLVASFSTMKPHIEKTIDVIRDNGFAVSVNLVPLCVMDRKYAELFPPLIFKPKEEYYFDPNFTEKNLQCPQVKRLSSRKCTPCLYKYTCHGFYPEYIDTFGVEEVRPITTNPATKENPGHFVWDLKGDVELDMKTVKRVRKNEYSILVRPETASWVVIKNKKLLLYENLKNGQTLSRIKQDFKEDTTVADNLDELFFSGVMNINGKSTIPEDVFERGCAQPDVSPRYLVIKYTRRCNLKCAYCYAHSEKVSQKDMPNETLLKIIRSAVDAFGDKEITVLFHGGEPLLRFHDIQKVVPQARDISENITFRVQSNGTLINREMAAFFKQEDISIGLSIDGFDYKTNKLRVYANGDNALIDILKGIEALYSENVRTGLISVISRQNYKKQCEMADFFIRHGLFSFVFNDFFPGGRGATKSNDMAVPVDEMVSVKKDLISLLNNYNEDRIDRETARERNVCNLVKHITTRERDYMCAQSPCGAARETLGFDCDGRMFPCDDFISQNGFSIGNIHEITDLKQHLDTHPVVRTFLSHNVKNIEGCSDCEWRWICDSHCAADAYYHAGHLNARSSKCRYYKKIIPDIIHSLCKGDINYVNFI
ncbi:MAG: hypothetical protein B5M56_01790 [Desulfococcus sp. 4484_241]|nr:MAG: hypothetical protein B5M56_01790 [Desulfococcus sp. 4484_241]